MKISNQFQSIQQSEVESKVEKYKGPDSIRQEGIVIPSEVIDAIENARRNDSDLFGVLTDAIRDVFNSKSKEPQIVSPVSKYNGPDSLEVKKPVSEVEKYKGPKSLPGNEASDRDDYLNNIEIPEELVEQLNRVRNNPPDPFARLTKILEDKSKESSEPKIASEVNQYKGPKYIGDR